VGIAQSVTVLFRVTVFSMRNLPRNFAILLTAIFSLHLSAQQTPPPETGSSSPVSSGATPAKSQPESRPMHIGGSVKPPTFIHQEQPMTDEATSDPALQGRIALIKRPFSGSVQISLWVDENGDPSHILVIRGLGMGLDERAVEMARQYKFKPATKKGKPVKVEIYMDVNFRLT
jgi:protein TonB